MPPFIDLTGQRYGKLTVIGFSGSRIKGKKLATQWLCECECGNRTIVFSNSLRTGKTKSCGCLNVTSHKTHGLNKTKIYRTWRSMLARCTNPNNPSYSRYGGRGIRVCDQWKKCDAFLRDMGFPPGEEFSIDRIDINGNYEPGNCHWATSKEQANNRSTNTKVEFQGRRLTITEWAREIGINSNTLFARFRNGWSVERMLTEPTQKYKKKGLL